MQNPSHLMRWENTGSSLCFEANSSVYPRMLPEYPFRENNLSGNMIQLIAFLGIIESSLSRGSF